MFVLSFRTAQLGGDHSGKTKEVKGQGAVKLLTFELERIPMAPIEVNALFGHPHAYGRLHCHELNDRSEEVLRPFLPGLKSLEFENTLEGAAITLRWGLDTTLAFTGCKLSKITIHLENEGETYLSCKVTTAPTLDETLAELFDRFGNPVELELRSYPPDAQKEIPLNQHGEGEQPAPDADGKKGSRRRRTH